MKLNIFLARVFESLKDKIPAVSQRELSILAEKLAKSDDFYTIITIIIGAVIVLSSSFLKQYIDQNPKEYIVRDFYQLKENLNFKKLVKIIIRYVKVILDFTIVPGSLILAGFIKNNRLLSENFINKIVSLLFKDQIIVKNITKIIFDLSSLIKFFMAFVFAKIAKHFLNKIIDYLDKNFSSENNEYQQEISGNSDRQEKEIIGRKTVAEEIAAFSEKVDNSSQSLNRLDIVLGHVINSSGTAEIPFGTDTHQTIHEQVGKWRDQGLV